MKTQKLFSTFISGSIILATNFLIINQVLAQATNNISFVERELGQKDLTDIMEVNSGKLNISFDISKEEITGTANFVIKNNYKKAINKFFFVLNSGLTINQLSIKNNQIKEIVKEKSGDQSLGYVVFLAEPVFSAGTIEINISYSGKIVSDYKFARIKDNDIFLTSQTNFYPRFSKLQKSSAIIDLQVTVPDEYIVVTQANNFKLKKEKDLSIITASVISQNGLTNEEGFNLASAKYKIYNSKNISIYYRDQMDKAAIEYMADFESKSLTSLNGVFGKHDYSNFHIVEVSRQDLGGMGSGNVVYLSDKYFGNYVTKAGSIYTYFKKLYSNDTNRIENEFKYYLRNVLAHESAHLFFNYFYSYDKPWFAEGFPEFISMKVLSEYGEKSDISRKLTDYEKTLKQLGNKKLPPLNQAQLNSNDGYFVNYWGTPLVLYQVWKNTGDNFWIKLAELLKQSKNITYKSLKEYFKFSENTADSFEKEFKIPETNI